MNKKAFTLLELLAVISIIGVLTAIALPQYHKVVEKAQFTKAEVMAKALYDSCERMVSEWGVDSYGAISGFSAKDRFHRLDIIPTDEYPDVLPKGFTAGETNISGAGFLFTLDPEYTEGCQVLLFKPEGTSYEGTSISYTGTDFACTGNADACNVYGLDYID